MGYTTYVFQNLDSTDIKNKYIMCIRYPNWMHGHITLNEKGFLHYNYVEAGQDSWYDGKNYISYRYTDCQFQKFIPEKQEDTNVYKM